MDEIIEDQIDPPHPHTIPSSHPLTFPAQGGLEEDFDPGLVWDEPDEGMGMEEEGDEEASDVIATPPPVVKRKRTKGSGKVDECPVCWKSLKSEPNEKVSNLASFH